MILRPKVRLNSAKNNCHSSNKHRRTMTSISQTMPKKNKNHDQKFYTQRELKNHSQVNRNHLSTFTYGFSPTKGEVNTQFHAKSMSLLNDLGELMKKPRRKSTAGRRAMTQIKYTQSLKDQISISKGKQSLGLAKTFLQINKRYQASQVSSVSINTKSRVKTAVGSGYDWDQQMRNQSLRRDINVDKHKFYCRSRRKVLAAYYTTKAKPQEVSPTNKLQSFSTLFYSKYLKHYMDRKKMLNRKDWIKKMVKN